MSWFDRDEICLHYRLTGEGERTLLLCHELGGALESWDGVAARLHAEFRILRWDQRGAGLSEKPVRPYGIDSHARDLAALVDHLALPAPYVLVGAAAGAAVALLFAQLRPQAIAGAILCAPALGVDPARRGYLLDRSAKAADLGMRGIVDASLGRSYPPEVQADAAVYGDYRARFLSNDPVAYGFANTALAEIDVDRIVSGIDFPVILLAGLHDRLRPPAYVESLVPKIPGAVWSRIESGHIMPVQAPEAIASAIRGVRSSSIAI